MITEIFLLIVGLCLIIAGGNYVTNGAVAVADRFHLSPLLIGLTVVAFGSSTPDLVVSVFSTIHGKSALAVGNILGAVIFDMLLVIGVMAMMKPLTITRCTKRVDLPVMVVGSAVLLLFAETKVFDPHGIDGVSRLEGILMLVCFILFMIYTIHITAKPGLQPTASQHPKVKKAVSKPMKMWLAVVCIVGGLGALFFGGQWTVNAASAIAKRIGMSEALIGLTVVGIGSSLPDLATSVIAALKGENAIALGNIVGSCIMDVVMVIGACAVVRPLEMAGISIVDFATLLGSALLLWAFGAFSRHSTISRREGLILVLLYVAYVCYLIFAR